jgi:hypothetical protein
MIMIVMAITVFTRHRVMHIPVELFFIITNATSHMHNLSSLVSHKKVY